MGIRFGIGFGDPMLASSGLGASLYFCIKVS